MGSEKPCNVFLYLKTRSYKAVRPVSRFPGSEDCCPRSRGPAPRTRSCPVTAPVAPRTLFIPSLDSPRQGFPRQEVAPWRFLSLPPSLPRWRWDHNEDLYEASRSNGSITMVQAMSECWSRIPLSVLLRLATSVQQEPFTAPYCLISATGTVCTYLGNTGRMSGKINKL